MTNFAPRRNWTFGTLFFQKKKKMNLDIDVHETKTMWSSEYSENYFYSDLLETLFGGCFMEGQVGWRLRV